MKIWVKLVKDKVITESRILPLKKFLNREYYEETLHKICMDLDVGTPVPHSSHFKHFNSFNLTKYLPRDFMEEVHFDYMLVELVKD